MAIKLLRVRHYYALFVLTLCLVNSERLHAGLAARTYFSPTCNVAIVGDVVYAVSEDQHTVIRARKTDLAVWEPFGSPMPFPVKSIAGDDGHVYLANPDLPGITALDSRSGRPVATAAPGIRVVSMAFQSPVESTGYEKLLFFLNQSGELFALTKPDKAPRKIDLGLGQVTGKGRALFRPNALSSSSLGLILIDSAAGVIARATLFRDPYASDSALLNETESSSAEIVRILTPEANSDSKTPSGFVPTTSVRNFPAKLERITAVTEFQGSIYVADQGAQFDSTAHLLVLSATSANPRPAKVRPQDEFSGTFSLLATDSTLFYIDYSSKQLREIPRPIPVEVRLGIDNVDVSLAALDSYLWTRNALPLKSVAVGDSLASTLIQQQVVFSAVTPEMTSLLCNINSTQCVASPPFKSGDTILIPDVYSESAIDVTVVSVAPKTKVSQALETRIHSPELSVWKSETRVAALNPNFQSGDILDASGSEFRLPLELIRLVVAFPASELKEGSFGMKELIERYPGLVLRPLVDQPATLGSRSQQQAQPPNPKPVSTTPSIPTRAGLSSADTQILHDTYQALMHSVHYEHPKTVGYFPRIAIADDIDCNNPDFAGNTCESLVDQQLPTMQSVRSSTGPQYTIRPFDDGDHGTSVASIIAAQKTAFGDSGFAAPETHIVQIRSNARDLVDDIQTAYVNGVKLFNLSLSFSSAPPGLLDEITNYSDALFVVAAGNDGVEICSQSKATLYPACWGDKSNVLTVAGTDLSGLALFSRVDPNTQKTIGSNWGSHYVLIAAPGDGFYGTGRARSYVPLTGTSFATPLVSATAALLQMESIFNGPTIKYRLIATAECRRSCADKVADGNFLNVSRAISNPGFAVITADDDSTQVIDLVKNGYIVVRTAFGPVTIQLNKLLRAWRGDDSYHFVYLEQNGNTVQLKTAEGKPPTDNSWKFAYYVIGSNDHTKKYSAIGNFKDFVGPVPE